MAPGPGLILRSIAFGLAALAALAAAMEFADRAAPEWAAPRAVVADPLGGELALCRALGFEEADRDAACKQAWAEKRRRFFGSSGAAPATE